MDLQSRTTPKSIGDNWTLTNQNFSKDVLLSTIIEKGGRFEPLYADPDYFYNMCGFWWTKWKRTFQKWFDIWDVEYTPLENYDRHEKTHEDTHDVIDNDTTYTNETDISEVTDDDAQTLNDISAYDTNQYQPHDKSTSTDDRTVTTDRDDTGSGTSDTDSDRDFDRDSYIHGNIGVMYATDMIDRELKSNYFNAYNHMADIFCSELLVRVY